MNNCQPVFYSNQNLQIKEIRTLLTETMKKSYDNRQEIENYYCPLSWKKFEISTRQLRFNGISSATVEQVLIIDH